MNLTKKINSDLLGAVVHIVMWRMNGFLPMGAGAENNEL